MMLNIMIKVSREILFVIKTMLVIMIMTMMMMMVIRRGIIMSKRIMMLNIMVKVSRAILLVINTMLVMMINYDETEDDDDADSYD